ncbi:Peroxisomal biogenesis factor 6 [Thelohanellus kitauei]|uniref:Peroxisomal biogenesis factor 6 n=1 Tax=Thelohanellus kitauei TaxID=669202 RepID=A0A0C2NLP1_THEKT|nr:Peroxisomal biogenesis factor 6 [Thelohanellus kitauei]
MNQNTSSYDILRIKERLIEKGGIIFNENLVQIEIPTERFSDVYGLDDLKDKFFTSIVLPLLKPQIFRGMEIIRKISIQNAPNKGVGHFVRALAGEYRFHLVTLHGNRLKGFDCAKNSQNMNDIKNLLTNLQPCILFIKHLVHTIKKDEKQIDSMEDFTFSNFQTDGDSVYMIVACGKESTFVNSEISYMDDPNIKSFSDVKKALRCHAYGSSPPPFVENDIRSAILIFSSGGLADVID